MPNELVLRRTTDEGSVDIAISFRGLLHSPSAEPGGTNTHGDAMSEKLPFPTSIPLHVLNAEISTYLGMTGDTLQRNGYVRVFHALLCHEDDFRFPYFTEKRRRQLFHAIGSKGLMAGALRDCAPFFMRRMETRVWSEYSTVAKLIEKTGWYQRFGRGRNKEEDAAVDAFLATHGLTVTSTIHDLFVYEAYSSATEVEPTFKGYEQEVGVLTEYGLPADALVWTSDLGITTTGELVVTLPRRRLCVWREQFLTAFHHAGLDTNAVSRRTSTSNSLGRYPKT